MIDILLFDNKDGGNLLVKSNDLSVVYGFANQVYLALFGGNPEALDKTGDENFDWFGNELLSDENSFNSRFEGALRENALNPNGIQKLENIAKKDLEFLSSYADLSVEVELYDHNKLALTVKLKHPEIEQNKITFLWDGAERDIRLNSEALEQFVEYAGLQGVSFDIINDTLIVY